MNITPALKLILGGCLIGLAALACMNLWPAWQVDYGKPELQILSTDAARVGSSYVGKLITVRGTVQSVDVSDSSNSIVYLDGGVRCNFGRLQAMARTCAVNSQVTVNGCLRRSGKGEISLDPAALTKTPFSAARW